MSAWLCSEEHIYEMAHYYVDNITSPLTVEEVAKIFYEANVNSLVARYDDDPAEMPMEMLPNYRPIVTNPIHMAKLINCYDYQACEVEDWDTARAHYMCERMLETLKLPKEYSTTAEYNHAPWGFEYAAYAKNVRIAELKKELAELEAS